LRTTRPTRRGIADILGAALLSLSLLQLSAQTEPPHPILTISGSGSGASTILSTWTESQYTNCFTPRLAPRNDSYGFVPPVVSGDTDWSWNISSPTQIVSTPSGTIFPTAAYTIKTQAVQVLSGDTVNAPYYNKAGSTTSKSLVFNLIDYHKLGQLRSDFNKLAPAYITSGGSPATRNDAYARRIAVALLDWARWFPDYTITGKNSASFIDAPPSYILPSDLQRASDHNGLAHEWADDELLAFDAIYDSLALTNLSNELGFDVRDYIRSNLFCNEGDFIENHVPVDVAIQSNLSGPYAVLPLVARVLNRPDYIVWMDSYLDATVRKKIRRDGVLEEGLGYSIGYLNANQDAAQNTRDYFLTRAATNALLLAISNRASIYNSTLTYGQSQWNAASLPTGQLPSFGDTPFNNYFSSHSAGNSTLLPAYGHVSMGAGSGSQAVQVNQNFPGDNNHMRSDITAFVLWAFNNEILGNIRYYNGAAGRQYDEQLLSHNAVVIDRVNESHPDADTYGNGDLTLYEPGNNGLALTEIDGQRAYANKASRYQRLLLLNSADLTRPYVVDVFRVTGGTNHDYVLHGAIRWDQTWECSFPLVTNNNPYPMLEGETWVEPVNDGDTFPYYGYWRNVSSNQAPGNFQVTYRDTNRVAGRDLRLWMTDDGTAKVNLGITPNPGRDDTVPANFYVYWRPSAIIRKRIPSGTLSDLFVSVIEPFKAGAGTIQSVERLPVNGSPLESCALKITFTDGRVDTYLVNLRNPQVAGANTGSTTVATVDGQFTLSGRVGVHTTGPAGSRVWAVNASQFQYPGGSLGPTNLYYSGAIIGETRRLTGGSNDAFVTTTPLPLGTALQGKQLSLTFGSLSGSSTTGISEMFVIDHVILTNSQYHICFARDHMLEITNSTTTVEQVAPLRTFTGTNQFEIALSASQPASPPIAPTGLIAIPGNGQVLLSWTALSGAASYNVKRATTNGGPYSIVASPVSNACTDGSLTNETIYYYVVSALNQAGESSNSLQVSATPNASAPTGMVARLTFDDGTASDSSGYGNHGTLVNGATIVDEPQHGKVLSLNGTDGYVDLGNGPSLNLSDDGQATITAWVKVAVSHNHNTILSKGEWKDAYSLVIKGDTTPANLLWTGNDTSVFSGDPVPLNIWTHVAVTINGDLTSFYLNGQLSGATNQDRGNPIDNPAVDVCIGREQYAGSLPAGRWFFNGKLDDVRIYQRALSQAEIQSVMADSVNLAPSFTSNPINKPSAVAGQGYSSSIASDAIDPNPGDTLTFSKLSGPAWLNVAGNGALSGTPLSADAGINSFVVRVTDSGNLFGDAALNLTVAAAPPILATISVEGDHLVLNWSGGLAPYQVQRNADLSGTNWQNFGGPLSTNRLAITPSNTAEFYRIQSQ
jgi:hypothetical protein